MNEGNINEGRKASKPEEERRHKINPHISYGGHAMRKDVGELKNLFRNADIYIPEIRRYDSEVAGIFQKVSSGALDPKNIFDQPFLTSHLEKRR